MRTDLPVRPDSAVVNAPYSKTLYQLRLVAPQLIPGTSRRGPTWTSVPQSLRSGSARVSRANLRDCRGSPSSSTEESAKGGGRDARVPRNNALPEPPPISATAAWKCINSRDGRGRPSAHVLELGFSLGFKTITGRLSAHLIEGSGDVFRTSQQFHWACRVRTALLASRAAR